MFPDDGVDSDLAAVGVGPWMDPLNYTIYCWF